MAGLLHNGEMRWVAVLLALVVLAACGDNETDASAKDLSNMRHEQRPKTRADRRADRRNTERVWMPQVPCRYVLELGHSAL